jgi:hypothetical protein
LKCTNGDGILLGKIQQIREKEIKQLDYIDKNAIDILKRYMKIIKQRGSNPIVVFEPIFHNGYRYNKKKIQDVFSEVNMVDLTDLKLEDTLWVDVSHLNEEGRMVYSKFLFEALRGVLK